MLFPWGDERRFHSYNVFLKQQFGGRMQKLTLDAGFTCPNRDGKCGTGGCSYCLNDAFNPQYCHPSKSITSQLTEGMSFHQHRSRNLQGYLAYFQAFSNTYAPLSELQALYEEALRAPNIRGIIIATRPDCIDESILEYLERLSERTYIALEIGIESCHDDTLLSINRGHDVACATHAIERAAAHHIPVGTHLIFGLPGEKPELWLQDLSLINELPIHSLKFHQLQIIKGTRMEQEYKEHPEYFFPLPVDFYTDFLVQYLERLRPEIVIERFASEVPARYLAFSNWGHLRYDVLLQTLEQKLETANTWQGRLTIDN